MKKQKVDWKVLSIALICLTSIEIYALSQGINGVMMSLIVAVIGGIAGITMPTPKWIKK